MPRTCSFCSREFSSSSNRIRHEELFHKKKNQIEMADSEHSEDERSVGHESDAEEEEVEDLWQEIIEYAHSECKVTPSQVLVEPYLSQFVEHMKEYVEERFKFVKTMESDEYYEKIQENIERFMDSEAYDREEAVDTAWHNRRFLIKRIIEENKELLAVKDSVDGDSDDDNVD